MRLKFHGDSDDIRLVGRDDCELMDVSGWGAESYIKVSKGEEGFYVRFVYDGCWSMAIRQLDENTPIPNWLTNISVDAVGYSADLSFDVPDDVLVEEIEVS